MSETAVSTPLLERLRSDIARVDGSVDRLGRLHRRLVVAGLTLTALATVVAGMASAGGPPIGEGPSAWRLTCGAVAIFTALAGVITGVNERFDYGGRLADARTCVVRLRALELSLTLRPREGGEVARQYEEILAQHPGYDV